jgi:hypothetical protein
MTNVRVVSSLTEGLASSLGALPDEEHSHALAAGQKYLCYVTLNHKHFLFFASSASPF